MTILSIETSTTVCSAAICKDGAPLKQCINLEGSNHARLLPLYIQDLLGYVRDYDLHLDAVGFSEGPGSYTGLRIGASTAKGLCYGLDIPLIPVPTLDVLCEAAKAKCTMLNAQSTNSLLVPMIDARRMEVYTKGQKDEGQSTKENDACAVVVESEESLLKGQGTNETEYYYFGDGAAKCQAVLKAPNWHFVPDIVPEAQYIGKLVESRTAQEESRQMIRGTELAYYEPFYLKEFIAAPSHVKGLV